MAEYKATPHFGWHTPEASKLDDVPGDMAKLANEIESDLHDLDVAELGTAGVGDAGKILIVQNTGDAAWAALSGAVAVSPSGVVGLNNEVVNEAHIKQLAVTALRLAENAVTESKIAGEAVSAAKVKKLAITAVKLAEEAVETAKLANLAVTTAKLATGAVTESKLAANAVGQTQLQLLAVTAVKLGEEAVTTAKLAGLCVTEPKLADAAVTSRKFKPTSGLIHSNAELDVSGGAFLNLPGASISFTPSVASRLYVVTAFGFQCTGVGANVSGTISVDGSIDTQHCCGIGWGAQTAQHSVSGLTEVYEVELTAALHTLRLVAAGNAGSGFTETVAHKNCSAMWWLAAK